MQWMSDDMFWNGSEDDRNVRTVWGRWRHSMWRWRQWHWLV